MKYIKLTGFGNNKTHLIPLKSISSFSEEDKYTAVRLSNGNAINVQESFAIIEELLDMAGVTIYDEMDIIDKLAGDDDWDVVPYSANDDLPF